MIKIYTLLLILSLTGIYIFPEFGIRSDHIIIYSIFLIFILSIILNIKKISINIHTIIIIILFLIFLLVGLYPYNVENIFRSVSQFENFFQPIAIVIITSVAISSFQNKFTSHEILTFIIEIYLFFLSMNTIFQFILLNFGFGDYVLYIAGPPDAEGLTPNERALNGGRATGFFGQPFDVGLAYSIGLICWAYLYDNKKNIKFINLYYLNLSIIFVGSYFSGSKLVQFLGVIFFIIYLLIKKNLIKFLFDKKNIFFLSFTLLVLYLIAINWTGETTLNRVNQYFILNRIF